MGTLSKTEVRNIAKECGLEEIRDNIKSRVISFRSGKKKEIWAHDSMFSIPQAQVEQALIIPGRVRLKSFVEKYLLKC